MSYVVVVGGTNVDVVARPAAAAVPATSNPGRVTVTAGGVGRNVAENLARLGTRTVLLSAVGDDEHAALALAATAEAGVDLTHVRRTDDATGRYVALLDAGGELVGAVSDMPSRAHPGRRRGGRGAAGRGRARRPRRQPRGRHPRGRLGRRWPGRSCSTR